MARLIHSRASSGEEWRLLRFLQVLVPSGDGTTTDPQPNALPEALAALGLSPDEVEANAEETQWLRLGSGDCFPAFEQPLSAPALWGLGPDGVRWATSFPEVVLTDGAAIPDDERVAVLLEGVVSRQGPEGEAEFSASRILPRIGPGERFTVTGERARLLLLPMSEVMPVLSAWRSID